MERGTWKLTRPYIKQPANGNLLDDSGNSNTALQQPRGVGGGGRWEGSSREGTDIYLYDQFMLMFDRSQQNSVKQSSFN